MFGLLFVQIGKPSSRHLDRGGALVQLLDLGRIPFVWCRPTVEVALNLGAAFFTDAVELRLRFDAFGNCGDTEALAQVRNGFDHGGAFRPIDRFFHERAINLDLVEGEDAQMREGGIAGPEIIERDPHAHVAKPAKIINGMGFSAEQRGFRDFDFQPVRGSVVISTLIHAKGILQVTGNT